MKIGMLSFAFVAAMLSSPALAQTSATTQSLSGSTSSVNIGGSSNNVKSQAPSLGGVGLTTSNDTCAGSFHGGGLSWSGFGINAPSSTYVIEDCNARADATLMWQMGMQTAAQQRLLQRPKIRAAVSASNQLVRQRAATGAAPINGRVVKFSEIPSGATYYNKRTSQWMRKR